MKYNATYFATQNIMNTFSKLDKDYDLKLSSSQSSILRELDVLLSNLKLKMNGDINLFAASINVSTYFIPLKMFLDQSHNM